MDGEIRAALARLCTDCGLPWESVDDYFTITNTAGIYMLRYKDKLLAKSTSVGDLLLMINGARLLMHLRDEAHHEIRSPFRV